MGSNEKAVEKQGVGVSWALLLWEAGEARGPGGHLGRPAGRLPWRPRRRVGSWAPATSQAWRGAAAEAPGSRAGPALSIFQHKR